MRTKKVAKQVVASAAQAASRAPRLVKAAEMVAREVVKSIPRPPQPARKPVRAPRSATEARALFNTLFGEPVKA